jgi:two-component system cell cycle response regulator
MALWGGNVRLHYFCGDICYIIAKQKAALIYLATTDELTGALNRKNLATSLSSSIESFKHTGTDTSLLLIDIDHFKTVNDTYGHLVGDKLLTQFSEVIKHLLPAEAKLFRFGGEEFLVQYEDCDLQKALEMAQRLKQAVNQTDFDGVPVNVSCSIGVAELRINDSLEEWLKQSDIALYAAKKSGRNRVVSRLDK